MSDPISSIPAAPSTSVPANMSAQTGAPGDLAALAVAAFTSGQPAQGVASQAAAAVTPATASAPTTTPNTVLSDEPVNVVDPAKTAAAVAAEAKVKSAEAPTYTLATPESGRLSKEHVAAVEAFAKAHHLTEAQAKQVLARDDLNVANAFDRARAALMKDPELGGAKIDQTIATTKRVLGLMSPEDRKEIASLPIANSRLLHAFCAKVAALLPTEDTSRVSGAQAVADKTISLGQAMYPHLYDSNGKAKNR